MCRPAKSDSRWITLVLTDLELTPNPSADLTTRETEFTKITATTMDFSTLDPISIALGVGIGLILAFLFSPKAKGASAGQINHDIQKNEPKVETMCPLKDIEDTVSKSDEGVVAFCNASGGGEDGDGDADQTFPLESDREKNKRAAIQRVMKDTSLTPLERNQAILKSFRAVSKSDKGGGEDGDGDAGHSNLNVKRINVRQSKGS